MNPTPSDGPSAPPDLDIAAAIAYLEDHIDHQGWEARSGRSGPLELSLERMRRLVAELGDPQRRVPLVHVTGTNGKGSTSRMVTRLLMAAGLRVGTYSSPHLAHYSERFRLDDVDIDDVTLAALVSQVARAEVRLGERVVPFEVLTAAAFRWFADEHVDVAVVEVGVLGRYDATNVGDTRVAVVTNIGFDHTTGEGDWQQRIAHEKAGIVEPGAHLVVGDVAPRLVPEFLAEGPGDAWILGEQVVVETNAAHPGGRLVTVRTPWQLVERVLVPLHGPHQGVNAAVAIAAASAFLGRPLRDDEVRSGFAAVRMPGRYEVVRLRPTVVLDGAHNPDAAAALAATVSAAPAVADGAAAPRPGRRIVVLGILAGRDPGAMLDALAPAEFTDVVACTPPTGRGRPADEVAAAAAQRGYRTSSFPSVGDALADVLENAGPDDLVVVTGSIYLVAEAREVLQVG